MGTAIVLKTNKFAFQHNTPPCAIRAYEKLLTTPYIVMHKEYALSEQPLLKTSQKIPKFEKNQ